MDCGEFEEVIAAYNRLMDLRGKHADAEVSSNNNYTTEDKTAWFHFCVKTSELLLDDLFAFEVLKPFRIHVPLCDDNMSKE